LIIPPLHPLLETKPRHVCISSSGAVGDGGKGFTFAGGGSGGQARDGGNIDITNNESGAIQTAGTASHDIDALSVGGASSTLSRHGYICTNRPIAWWALETFVPFVTLAEDCFADYIIN
jgi:hypothetical protein